MGAKGVAVGGWVRRWVVGQDDDVDTDGQEEDQERQPLLCHPRPHLAPTGSKSTGGNWGNQR